MSFRSVLVVRRPSRPHPRSCAPAHNPAPPDRSEYPRHAERKREMRGNLGDRRALGTQRQDLTADVVAWSSGRLRRRHDTDWRLQRELHTASVRPAVSGDDRFRAGRAAVGASVRAGPGGVDDQRSRVEHTAGRTGGRAPRRTPLVTDLLVDLRERGLAVTRPMLVGLGRVQVAGQGGAQRARSPGDPALSICVKVRNVKDHLPQRLRSTVGRRMTIPTLRPRRWRPRRRCWSWLRN